MKKIPSLLILLLPGLVFADSVTLKSGREIKGDVISNGPEGVLIDYYVTSSIKDQKLIPKEEIASISVITPDEKAFSELGDMTAPATVLDTFFYDSLIEKKIPDYLSKYPYSRHLGELRQASARLEAERSKVRRGDRKIDGSWITVQEIEADPYLTTSRIKFAFMKERSQANDPVSALQTYELIEKNYPGSRVLPDALDMALIQLDLLQEKVIRSLGDFEIIDKKRQNAIKLAPADQAMEMKDALAKDVTLSKAAIAAAQDDGTKFFPVFPNNKEALQVLKTLISTERARLLALQKTPMRDGIRAADDGLGLAAAGKLKEAQDQLSQAQKLWPANHDLAKLTSKLDQLAKAEAEEAARQKSQPSASPSPKK